MNHCFNFEWEFRDFKIKTNHEGDINSSINRDCPIELIRFLDDTNTKFYTVAYWEPNEDGYNLRFVGDRPFTDITPEEIASIWVQLGAAQQMLNEFFEACDREKELEYW